MNKVTCVVILFSCMTTAWAAESTVSSTSVEAAKIAAVANPPVVNAVNTGTSTKLVSPRTGMRYIVNNPGNRSIVFQTEALAPVSAQNVSRIVATNPALSVESQQMAMRHLLQMTGMASTSTTDSGSTNSNNESNPTPPVAIPSPVLPTRPATP